MKLQPSYFFAQVNSLCNSRCITCHMWSAPVETLPVATLKRIGLFLDPVNTRSIFLTGGEPLLPPTCVEVAIALNEWKPGVPIISATNGIAPDLYIPRVIAMQTAGVHVRFAVSLNGLPDTHDRSRGVPGNHDKAVETARRLKECGALASLNILFIPDLTTDFDLNHVVKLAYELGVPCWSSPILRHNQWFGEEDDGATVPTIPNCHAGGEVLTIRPNGDITACQETRPNLILGNLNDDGLDSERVAAVQEIIRTRGCQPCGCWTNAFSEGMFVS